ncbi:MAG: VRR-NUC domain-containing protein, partial [Terriglobales bacterium]
MRLYANHYPQRGAESEGWLTRPELEKQALDDIKQLHATCPKYRFEEPSQKNVIERFAVEVVDLRATYESGITGKARIVDGPEPMSVEQYARGYFQSIGFKVILSESRPLHVLFGAFLWLLVQEPTDPKIRIVGIADRNRSAVGNTRPAWFLLPEDFGTPGYGERRRSDIDDYFVNVVPHTTEDLLWAFDYWLECSQRLRQYLWAEEIDAVSAARQILEVLPPQVVRRILRYLVDSYWTNFCGWPDLLVWRGSEFFFVEVKSSHDKLSEDQKHWISENHARLMLPF